MSSTQQLILGEGAGGAPAGYQIERSLRFNSANSTYLDRTPASASNRKTWTWSGWVKRSTLGNQVLLDAGTAPNTFFRFDTNEKLAFADYTSGPTYNIELITTQVFRDFGAWGHITLVVDTTQATSSNRVKLYWNGSQITAFTVSTYPSQNFDTGWNAATAHRIGSYLSSTNFFNGYLTEINFIDGQALTPSSFGETDTDTGVWKPKKYEGTYGTNGFYLKFADNSGTTSTTLGKDSSGIGIRSRWGVEGQSQREVGRGSRQAWAGRALEGQRAWALGLVPGAGRKPVEPAAGKPAAAVEAVPDRQSQQASAHRPANPVEPPGAAVAVALARNPVEPPVAVRIEVAAPAARIPGELVVGAPRHIPAQPVGVQERYFVSRSRS